MSAFDPLQTLAEQVRLPPMDALDVPARRLHWAAFVSSAVFVVLAACGADNEKQMALPASGTGAGQQALEKSLLVSSRPAAGSTVSAPVNELVLYFSLPVRLAEITVTGPDGAMPMMVTAVGETQYYSLPLSGLEAGAYIVAWRASKRGVDHRGDFAFKVQ